MKKQLNVICCMAPHTAFGQVSQLFIRGLVAYGWDLRVVDFAPRHVNPAIADVPDDLKQLMKLPLEPNWPRFNIHYLTDEMVANVHEGDILYTLWETDRLPKHLVPCLNKTRAVLTSTVWGKSVMRSSGIRPPVYVTPLGVDTSIFTIATNFPKGKIFATAGRSVHGRFRKGLDRVVAAFQLAFPTQDDVTLRIKSHRDCESPRGHDPRVQWVYHYLTPADLARFYQEALCYVSGSCGEGWGMHQHEALACGKPLIGVNWGGVTEFFKGNRHGYALPKVMRNVTDYYWPVGRWAVPSIDDMAEAMRDVYDRPLDYFVRGLQASLDVSKFNVKNAHNTLNAVIQRLV